MPQSLHVLNAHIIFSTKERRPWLTQNIRERVWAYQSRILQNLECNSITIGGAADHVHVLCNLTKKFPTAKVLEILKQGFVQIHEDVGRARFSLAGWLWALQCEPVTLRSRKEIHSRPRRASRRGDVPDDPRAVPSAMMAQAVGLPSEICSHSCSRFKRNARSDFVSASSNALPNCSAAASRLFNRISSSPITE
jgi:REP element-mobilizing transposase RayT